jgi:hypothetical protein
MSRSVALAAALAASAAAALPPPQNPFCGFATARDSVSVTLGCANGGVITGFDFAAYGTPSGSCSAGWSHNASCDAPTAMSVFTQACANKTWCTLVGDGSTFPDPCNGVIKSIAVTARCSDPAGGYQVVVQPSCATSDGSPPCPLPTWTPTYQVNRSTICQPGNVATYLNATQAAQWGLISLDWSIAYGVWNTGLDNATGAATLVEQCRQIKAVNPLTKCLVYRNTELALAWLEPQRAVMDDPAFASYFLQYQPGNPSNTTPGTLYNEDAGFPANGFRQYFWNYSNPDVVGYVLGVSEQGELGTGSPYVDGTFLDDSQAIPQEHGNAPANIGLTPLQLASIQNDTHNFVQTAITTLASTGHYIWQGFNNNPGGDPDEVAPGPSAGSCSQYMEMVCAPSWQLVPMTMQWGSDKEQLLAAFLIGRGPYAYVGYGWTGGPIPAWDPIWDAYDVGTPSNLCTSNGNGVYGRNYTNGYATLDCNSWTATLAF